jgi:anti-sigma B factor antagonist
MDLQLSARLGRACTVVGVRGEIDMDTAPMLEDLLREVVDAGTRHVVLDFTGVTFIDSHGLSVLTASLKRLRAAGGCLSLAHVRQSVRNILVVSALDRVLDMYDTVAAAEDDLPSMAA